MHLFTFLANYFRIAIYEKKVHIVRGEPDEKCNI